MEPTAENIVIGVFVQKKNLLDINKPRNYGKNGFVVKVSVKALNEIKEIICYLSQLVDKPSRPLMFCCDLLNVTNRNKEKNYSNLYYYKKFLFFIENNV